MFIGGSSLRVGKTFGGACLRALPINKELDSIINKLFFYGQVSPTESAKDSFAYPQSAPAKKYTFTSRLY